MEKRTQEQVESDYRKIAKIVKTSRVCTLEEIAEEAGLTKAKVRQSLIKHPVVFNRIKKILEENRRAKGLENVTKAEIVQDVKDAQKPEKEADMKYVIDASICGVELFSTVINKCIGEGGIILTNITVRELDNLQKGKDKDAVDARRLLAQAAKSHEGFKSIKISEVFVNPDDNIIEYCRANGKKLITADKVMALKARAESVEVTFVEQRAYKQSFFGFKVNERMRERRVEVTPCTLVSTNRIGKALYITACLNPKRCVRVFTPEGSVVKEGLTELRRGYKVFILTRKDEYITFSDYEISKESETDNAKNIFHARLYKETDIEDLPDESYKKVAREFFYTEE